MTKKKKILIAILAAISIVGLEIAVGSYWWSQNYSSLNGHIRGKLEGTSVSPNGRWEISYYEIYSGAWGSDRYYAVVTDQKGKVPTREIDFQGAFFTSNRVFRWKNNYTVYVYGQETNVRTATVFLGASVSPKGRWRVKGYDTYPIGERYGYTYAEIVDLENERSTYKVVLDPDRESNRIYWGSTIHWNSANVVDVYGQIIDVRKLKPGASGR